MDKTKIDAAVKVMQALTMEERAAVNYTVEREGKKRTRKSTRLNPLLDKDEPGES